MRMWWLAGTLVLAAAIAPGTAIAQRTIEAPANVAWKHAPSGITLPARTIGVERREIRDLSADQIDIAVSYGDDPTFATIYLFRPSLMSVPVWFDRAETAILLRDTYAHPTAPAAAVAFAPPGGGAASGLRRVYVPGGGSYKSTGLAVMPMGEWLVVVRVSSQVLDPAALDGKISEVIAAIGWPRRAKPSPVAAAVLPCGTPLAYASDAKLKGDTMSDTIMGSVFATITPDDKVLAKATPTTWCREGDGQAAYGVYRPGADYYGYTVAMGDAGVTVAVTPGLALGKDDGGYRLQIGLLDRTLILPSFDKLPAPDLAVRTATSTAPTASVPHGGKNVTIFTK